MAYLEAYGDKVVGGGSGGAGGGHVIVNASGTEMAQEEKLQFAGTLKTTDDSTNGKTVVSDAAEEVEWSTWNAMTEQERIAYAAGKKIDIINVPGADGSISADLMTKLWENPSPTSAFAAQNITLASDDYDFLLFVYMLSTTDSRCNSALVRKGDSAKLDMVSPSSDYPQIIIARNATYLSNTSYSISLADAGIGGTYQSNNIFILPQAVYGIKKSINFKFSALAPNVSTSANKCMLSDGVTSVESAMGELSTVVEGTITNVLVPTRADVLQVYKAGRVVQVIINNVIYSSSFSADTRIFRLPYKPAMSNTMDVGCRFMLFNENTALSFGFVKASTGDVYLNNYTSGKLLYGNIVYLTDD